MSRRIYLMIFLCFFGSSAFATSFARIGLGDIVSIDHKPAICIPKDAVESMPVGFITVGESYVSGPKSWGVDLKENAKPLVLMPGDCVVYGVIPEGYELPMHEEKRRSLELKVNRTYNFMLDHAYRSRTWYAATFCIEQAADGAVRYVQYKPVSGGRQTVPSCDAKLNGNAPEQFSPKNLEGSCLTGRCAHQSE
ncbi:hypothetical protein [Pseudomonas gingeri]|uniref:hypothetical protein n=1 Tax=Pseudomonas gingeri TaxID=117681 RepID=UPI0015A2FF7D|nr:hypothetical protein [Pseudomonas gingeri]NWA05429.1 hypothetical protein [Pseudomonas gingeri]NWA17852.1 hypothetical protein [Pseudomonas gingeri]NWA57816.1 hypothetical protein [Pseudomonas gingeri]NWA98837.1 hypothetical protein [Pseudomonas gingeri]NWB05963.1 hypothetical protein [Pseudomonas gingeri]